MSALNLNIQIRTETLTFFSIRKRYSIWAGEQAGSNGPVTLEWEVIHKVPYVGVFCFDL